MVKIIKGEENKIPVRVTSLIDYSGFSAKLEIAGLEKTVADLSKNPKVLLSSSDVETIGASNIGTFTVYNTEGEVHAVYKIFFSAVDSASAAVSFNVIRVTIVASFKYDWYGSGGGGDLSRRVSNLEVEMQDKVSIYYDESDSEIGFEDGHNESDDSL